MWYYEKNVEIDSEALGCRLNYLTGWPKIEHVSF